MKKIFYSLVLFIIFWLFNNTNANVDVTNVSSFRYDCTANWWILYTDFNLWWHHHYIRNYKINNPWIIEIADWNHTTVSKNSNVSIDWCNYIPTSCDIKNNWTWEYITWSDIDYKTILIETDLEIIKSNNTLNINWKSSHWPASSIKITYNWSTHDFSWEDISIDMQNDKIVLDVNWDKQNIITFVNKIYNSQNEFYYSFWTNNKTIILKRKSFKRVNTWTTISSPTPQIFEAGSWSNPGFTLSSNKDARGPEYTTWLNFWDYTQHYYTTTKVKIHPVTINCSLTEYSNWKENELNSDPFNWTLAWIIQSVYDWDNMKINWWLADKMFADSNINISWIYYKIVWEVWWVKDKVNGVTLTIKKDAITKWVSSISTTEKWINDRNFWNLIFNLKVKTASCEKWNETSCVTTTSIPADNYWLEILFTYNWNKVWEPLATGLLIKTNNDYTKVWNLNTIINWWTYANNSDNYKLCQNITDSYWNKYSNMTNIEAILSWNWFYLDQINNIWEWIDIYNTSFNNSEVCFNIKSYSPWKKSLTFNIAFPTYNLNWDISGYKQLSLIKEIIFNKPFSWTLSIVNASKKLEIWPSLNMLLNVIAKSNLSIYSINDFSSSIILWDNTNHEFVNFPSLVINSDNKKYNFSIDAKTDAWINIAPKIITNPNPVISYVLWWKSVKYYINNTEDPAITSNLFIDWISWNQISWVKIIWTSQTSGKAAVTNKIVNFSDLSKSTMRSVIKRNASIITKWLTEWKILNWVIYYNWDTKISEIKNLSDVETLVIKNWNLIIDRNLMKEKFGIIVTRDDNSKENLWNIYVIPGVTYISAIIYADWWIISSNNNWIPYTSDTDTRTNDLSNQLVIKWSTFTRNTIWWAVKGTSGKYILPGWTLTSDFNKAMMYDLNYVRRSNDWWDLNKDKNNNNSNNVVIIYNSIIQTNPPKWFTSN